MKKLFTPLNFLLKTGIAALFFLSLFFSNSLKAQTPILQHSGETGRSDSPLGHCYRRLKSRMGPKAAKCAMARKLAVICFNMVTKKEAFNMELFEQHQAAFKEKRIKSLEKQLFDLKEVA